MRVRFLSCALLAACSGGGGEKPGHTTDSISMDPLPERVTTATLSGPLCEGDKCTCRDLDKPEDGGAGYPDRPGQKRFELHVGPAENELWVKVDDMVLYKSDQKSEDCFYVDLGPGPHKVQLRASRDGGLSASLDVHELGATSKSWYDTFHFACGSPGVCSTDELDEWKGELAKYTRSLWDGCGSTKIKQVAWDAGRAPDQQHPKELQLDFVLDVYQFQPDLPHGDPQCRDKI
jgi:hypothetical protein